MHIQKYQKSEQNMLKLRPHLCNVKLKKATTYKSGRLIFAVNADIANVTIGVRFILLTIIIEINKQRNPSLFRMFFIRISL